MQTLTTGLRFPEGPVWLHDGSIALVEIERKTVTAVAPDGSQRILSRHEGGPNGLAVGPDGAFYVCNNGGFTWHERDGLLRPGYQPPDYVTGRIERVDPATGAVTLLYDRCGEYQLRGPNDIVFDTEGGFYFTDLGKTRPRERDQGGIYYAKIDGSFITEVAFPLTTPNGIGLSPDGTTVYVAETATARVWAFDLASPGKIKRAPSPSPHGGRLVATLPGYQMFDSLAIDAAGNICVATLITGAITVISPAGEVVRVVKFPDAMTTNICFGGPDLRRAFVTLSSTGQLVALDWTDTTWDVPGLRLNYEI